MSEGKKSRSPELQKFEYTVEGKKGEGEVLLSEDEVREHLGEGETMKRRDNKYLLLGGMSVKRAKELADAMGAKMATLEDLLEAFGVDPKEARKRVKALEAPKKQLEESKKDGSEE